MFWRVQFAVVGALATFILTTSVASDAAVVTPAGKPLSFFMRTFGHADAPSGYRSFCDRQPANCQGNGERGRIDLTTERARELAEVNLLVNATVVAQSDRDTYGVEELWTLPARYGDCEDYALLKQKMLTDRGWPAGALLLTVVRDELGEGHALLTVRTTEGDLLLDNRVNDIRSWTKSIYTFVKRQSYLDPQLWMSLDGGPKALTPVPTATKN